MYNQIFTKNNYTKYFIESLLPICPDIGEYSDSIHAVYAGLDPDFSIHIQSLDSITDQILEAVKNGKTRIIFTTLDEDFIESIVFKIHSALRYLSKFNLSCKYYYCIGAFKFDSMYSYILNKYKFTEKLIIIPVDYSRYCARSDGIFSEHTVPDYSVKIKEKLFLSFNNILRPHRTELLDHMFKEDLVNKSYYSFYPSIEEIPNCFENIDHNRNMLPLILNKENKSNIAAIAYDDIPYYVNSYFSLVTETFFDYHDTENSSIYITEKTYKPIALKHPFIVLGKPYILKTLRELGFKTFSPYINESYDDIKDNKLRMKAVVKEVRRLCDFTQNEWLEWQEQVKEIVNHNHSCFMNSSNYALQKFADYA